MKAVCAIAISATSLCGCALTTADIDRSLRSSVAQIDKGANAVADAVLPPPKKLKLEPLK